MQNLVDYLTLCDNKLAEEPEEVPHTLGYLLLIVEQMRETEDTIFNRISSVLTESGEDRLLKDFF